MQYGTIIMFLVMIAITVGIIVVITKVIKALIKPKSDPNELKLHLAEDTMLIIKNAAIARHCTPNHLAELVLAKWAENQK